MAGNLFTQAPRLLFSTRSTMITIPVPAEFDTTAYEMGVPIEVTATVILTDKGMELQAIDGMPVETEEMPMEEVEDTELDEAGLEAAMGRTPMMEA